MADGRGLRERGVVWRRHASGLRRLRSVVGVIATRGCRDIALFNSAGAERQSGDWGRSVLVNRARGRRNPPKSPAGHEAPAPRPIPAARILPAARPVLSSSLRVGKSDPGALGHTDRRTHGHVFSPSPTQAIPQTPLPESARYVRRAPMDPSGPTNPLLP